MTDQKIELSFPRDFYLECAEQFEGNCVDCVDQELSEFGGDPEDIAYELAYTRYALAKEEKEAEALRAQMEATKQQAQIWKMEARAMQNTVAECYQSVTGKAGEPGNWNGALPVVELIEELRKELEELKDGLTTAYMVGYESGRDSLLQVVRHLCNVYILDDYYTGEDRAVMLNRVVEKQIDTVKDMNRAKAEGGE